MAFRRDATMLTLENLRTFQKDKSSQKIYDSWLFTFNFERGRASDSGLGNAVRGRKSRRRIIGKYC